MPTAGKAYGPTYDLYKAVIAAIPGGVGSGIVAAKSGYHSSRAYNQAYHSGNYSIRNSYDLQGPSDGAAAIDVTMSTSNMKFYTKRMFDAMARRDPRVRAVKEFIGTLDGRTVIRFTRDHPDQTPWKASSDSSHLWHGHWSLFRAFINDWNALKGIVDVVKGVPAAQPTPEPVLIEGGDDLIGLKRGDSGQKVIALQCMLQKAGFNPGTIDGVYDTQTSTAVLAMRKSRGSGATSGDVFDGWAYEQLQSAFMAKFVREAKMEHNLPVYGDHGAYVGYVQRLLRDAGETVEISNKFDAATKAALASFYKKTYPTSEWDGSEVTSGVLLMLEQAAMKGEQGPKGDKGDPWSGDAVVSGTLTVNPVQ